MGAHPDDRDSVTDMTFLMFTCKAGAAGVGDGTMAAKVLRFGIEMGLSKNMYLLSYIIVNQMPTRILNLKTLIFFSQNKMLLLTFTAHK